MPKPVRFVICRLRWRPDTCLGVHSGVGLEHFQWIHVREPLDVFRRLLLLPHMPHGRVHITSPVVAEMADSSALAGAFQG